MKPLHSKAALVRQTPLRKVMVGLALAAGLTLGAFGVIDSAHAQTGGFCSKFDGGALDGWAACPPPQNNIVVTAPPTGGVPASGGYLELKDLSGGSVACTFDSKYMGNWLQKMGGCGQFCFDFKVTSSGQPPSAITPSFTIYGGGGHATFVANFSVPIGDRRIWWREETAASSASARGRRFPPATSSATFPAAVVTLKARAAAVVTLNRPAAVVTPTVPAAAVRARSIYLDAAETVAVRLLVPQSDTAHRVLDATDRTMSFDYAASEYWKSIIWKLDHPDVRPATQRAARRFCAALDTPASRSSRHFALAETVNHKLRNDENSFLWVGALGSRRRKQHSFPLVAMF